MMQKYTIRAYYSNGIYIPNGSLTKFVAVLTPLGMQANKQPLIPTIERLLKGEHDQIFGGSLDDSRTLTADFPDFLTLKIED